MGIVRDEVVVLVLHFRCVRILLTIIRTPSTFGVTFDGVQLHYPLQFKCLSLVEISCISRVHCLMSVIYMSSQQFKYHLIQKRDDRKHSDIHPYDSSTTTTRGLFSISRMSSNISVPFLLHRLERELLPSDPKHVGLGASGTSEAVGVRHAGQGPNGRLVRAASQVHVSHHCVADAVRVVAEDGLDGAILEDDALHQDLGLGARVNAGL